MKIDGNRPHAPVSRTRFLRHFQILETRDFENYPTDRPQIVVDISLDRILPAKRVLPHWNCFANFFFGLSIFFALNVPKSNPPPEIQRYIFCIKQKNIISAQNYLIKNINPEKILITGSLYLIGKVRKLFI